MCFFPQRGGQRLIASTGRQGGEQRGVCRRRIVPVLADVKRRGEVSALLARRGFSPPHL